MTIDQAIETIVDSGEYRFYGTYVSQVDGELLYKIRRVGHQGNWGLNSERELFTLARLFQN